MLCLYSLIRASASRMMWSQLLVRINTIYSTQHVNKPGVPHLFFTSLFCVSPITDNVENAESSAIVPGPIQE